MPKARRKKAAALGRRPRRAAASRAGGAAVAELAHEIRTPLTGILALSELLLASGLPAQQQQWAAAVKEAGEHLARLTTLVVDAAKAEAGGVVLCSEPFSPRALLEAAARSLKARVEGKGLAVRVSSARTLPSAAIGDMVRLRSALENLIDNAVKFTARGGIRLAATASRAARGRLRLTFAVTDSGVGIVQDDIPRLFRPFAQASADVAQRYGGTGLGLMLVRRIARAMGGDVTVSSRPGRGSTFTLTVLVAPAPVAPRRPQPRRGAARRRRLLCVDDNPYGRVVLNVVLGELGHRVDFVASGEEAVAAAARGGHDAVLMDIALGGIDGFEATRRIRALASPQGAVPVIGVSGGSGDGDPARAAAAGMDAYLRKPASPAALQAALEKIPPRKKPRPART
jgi:CheY-like chemotaxis protein/nitrogen-specific signal transduction histidine kinase